MPDVVKLARQQWKVAFLALSLFVAAGSFVVLQAPAAGWTDAAPGEQRLMIAPFDVDPSLRDWAGSAFEDSLAHRISIDSELIAHAGGDATHADYVLDARILPDGNQVMITLRLRPASQRAATWTATFWRPAARDSILSRDFAVAVAEAVRAHRR